MRENLVQKDSSGQEDSSNEMGLLKTSPKYRENPFIDELFNIKRKNKTVSVARNKAVVDTMTGEQQDTLFIGIREEVDQEQFVKVFQSSLQELFGLSKKTLKVVAYLMSITTFNDRIMFDLDDCKAHTGYTSKDTIFKALRELVDGRIIAKTVHSGVYFINPSVFYKGDRLTVIKEYRIKKEKAIDKNQTTLPFDNA